METIKETDINYVRNYIEYRINRNLPLEATVIESELISKLGQPLWYVRKVLKVLSVYLNRA